MKRNLTQNLAAYNLFNKTEGVNIFNNTRKAIKLITHFFSSINVFISKPIFTVTTNSVIVHVFYYHPATAVESNQAKALNNNTVNNLGETLSSFFGRSVELRLVKLHYPYLNRYILAQYIALNTQDYKLVHIIRRIFGAMSPVKKTTKVNVITRSLKSSIVDKNITGTVSRGLERGFPAAILGAAGSSDSAIGSAVKRPAFYPTIVSGRFQGNSSEKSYNHSITTRPGQKFQENLTSSVSMEVVGIKVCLSGRLMTERSRPRQTVQTVQIGSFAKNNRKKIGWARNTPSRLSSRSLLDSAIFTGKNKKGAFTIKVWLSQRIVV